MTDEHITPSAEHPVAPPNEAEAPSVEKAADQAPVIVKRGGTPLWLTLLLVGCVAAEPFVLPIFLPDIPAATPPALPDNTAILSRLAALETTASGIKLRVTALESSPAAQAAPADTSRFDTLESRLAVLEKQPSSALPDVAGQVAAAAAALETRIAALDAEIKKDVTQSTARAAFANRLRAASAALEAGQPLGSIEGAGPDLARFASTPAPTEPALRLSFPRYEEAARAASQPVAPVGDPLARAWERVQSLITIRQGDHVLIGSPASVLLEEARGKVDVADLSGAVSVLAKLDDAAKAAMGKWLDDAKALLDARAALLALVAKS
jgi:hypothetical protein